MTTNRKWLETLSNEEFIKWSTKTCDAKFGDVKHCVFADCAKCARGNSWLQAEHSTTADEDFAEIGFVIETTQPLYICYVDDNGRLLYILKHQNEYDTNDEGWGDELVDTVRTIADKKRKEMNW